MRATSLSSIAFGLILMTLACHCYGHPGLHVGFYRGKCGHTDIEKVIYEVVKKKIKGDPDVVSDLTRLSFHDCFIRGCDASIFLNGKDTEKTSTLNKDLGGFKAMDEIKAAVEKACPGVVSCADVLVIATRASIALARGLWYEVETGRRDSLVSLRSEADTNIPPPTMPVPVAIRLFESKGLNKNDFVYLLGGHTVGTAHCHSFKERLYNFKNTNKPDPSMSSSLLKSLRDTCPLKSNADGETFLDQTPNSHFIIDNGYYKQIVAHNGTMEIDQNLADNHLTRGLVKRLAYNNDHFLKKFGPAMVKMSRIGVLTGNQGEIRRTCGSLN